MVPRGLFPANPDLADILDRTDFDFENFYFLDFVGSQLGPGLGPAWARLGLSLGPGLGHCTCLYLYAFTAAEDMSCFWGPNS